MTDIHVFLDIAMCVLWILTYTLVLIGTLKYHYPLISPATQAIIAPLEFAVLFMLVLDNVVFNYAYFAYVYWSIVEIAIIFAIIKQGGIKRNCILPYILLIIIMTGVMIYFVVVRGYVCLFCFYNTTVGVIIWLVYAIRKKDYPINLFTLAIFIVKLIADIFAYIAYAHSSDWPVNMAILAVVDVVFIAVWVSRRINTKSIKKQSVKAN